MVKSPVWLDEPDWEMLVSRLVIVMATPGITAPVESVTRPTTLAEGCWALRHANEANRSETSVTWLFIYNSLTS
jgi:hypothetical protein